MKLTVHQANQLLPLKAINYVAWAKVVNLIEQADAMPHPSEIGEALRGYDPQTTKIAIQCTTNIYAASKRQSVKSNI